MHLWKEIVVHRVCMRIELSLTVFSHAAMFITNQSDYINLFN